MDTNIGAKERVTQNRLIGLFKNVLKYTYLGNWETREDNANIEEKLLTAYLSRRGYTDLPFIHKYILFFLSLLDVIRDRSNS